MRRVRKFFSTFSLTCTNFWVSRTTTSDRRAGGARLRKSKIWKFRLGGTRSSPFSTWFYGGKNGFDGGLRTGFECSSNPYRPFNPHGTIRPVEFFFQLFDRFFAGFSVLPSEPMEKFRFFLRISTRGIFPRPSVPTAPLYSVGKYENAFFQQGVLRGSKSKQLTLTLLAQLCVKSCTCRPQSGRIKGARWN